MDGHKKAQNAQKQRGSDGSFLTSMAIDLTALWGVSSIHFVTFVPFCGNSHRPI
jgi:hypothetical protein